MSKIIISAKILGIGLMDVIYRESKKLAEELNLDKDQVIKDLDDAQSEADFHKTIKTHFGNKLKVIL